MFNGADSIEQTLASLTGQTRLPDHVIVIDDGSSDDGPQRVKDFAAPFRLTLLQQANEGPASARNHGLRHTEETLVAFLDADDQWHPHKLEKQLALYDDLLRQGRPVGLIDCNVMIDYSDGTRLVEDRYKNGMHFHDFIHCNIVNGVSAVLIRRDLLTQLGGFETSLRYSEDRMMWARIAEHREIHTVPQILVRRTVNDGNVTAQPKKYYPHKLRFIELVPRPLWRTIEPATADRFRAGQPRGLPRCLFPLRRACRSDHRVPAHAGALLAGADFQPGQTDLALPLRVRQNPGPDRRVNHRSLNRGPPWPTIVWLPCSGSSPRNSA
ncbi:UNVERIFIED_ORG: hypothetical protein OKW16_001284 [Pseudomonas reinekei]|nr:hypothetical protein [Pseudomonas reinekei]